MPAKKITIIQEDRHSGIAIDGMPDFFVYEDYNAILKSLVGFIECKKPSYKLEKLIESEQIKKYAKTCENIILTNYHRFILLQKGKIEYDIELSDNQTAIQNFINLLQDFYGYIYPYIGTKKTLVSALASQSFYYSAALREYIENRENVSDSFYIKFNGLFVDYQTSINYSYNLTDFCDIYSQSLVYGLLLARLDTQKDLDEKDLRYLDGIPSEYKLLYEFLSQGYESRDLPTSIKIAITNIGKNINLIDIEAIQKEFNQASNGKQNIAVYLYEDFLQQYDNLRKTEKRKEGGVYYTPQEASDFITRSVNDILKSRFNLSQGYLSENIKTLDFACGTGTFLHSIFEQIITDNTDILAKSKIKQKILNDIYGFELLFTPYIVAHTILTKYLKDKGINISYKERLGIYLTNTLDISQHSISSHLPNLKREYETAMQIKDQENILAIVGNPPYFGGKSQAKRGIIDGKYDEYYRGINEKKLNKDIYEKFIRFAEWKIEKCGEGVVGIITNNTYLDGVTKRKMREHLYKTFDEIYIINLHGNTRKGDTDNNIFDIMVGVSIAFFIKHKKTVNKKTVKYFSTLENNIIKRQQKLDFLANISFDKIKWKELHPEKTENFWFVYKDFSQQKEYNKFVKLTHIFEHYNSGFKTSNDKFTIQYSKKKIEKIVDDFKNIPFYEVKNKYSIEDGLWTAEAAFKSLQEVAFDKKFIKAIQYRPFDNRFTFLHEKQGFMARPCYSTAKHFENKNIGLCFTRQLIGNEWKHILVSENMIDACAVSLKSREWTYLAPLYIYNGGNGYAEIDFDGHKRYANFTQNFIKNYLKKLDFQPTPEEILAYIYAILYSPIYRTKYLEFLKTDFPAVPMTKDKKSFRKYVKLGQKLIDLHLFKEIPNDIEIRANFGKNNFVNEIPDNGFVVEKINYENNTLFLYFVADKENYNLQELNIDGVTTEIYNFEIGSYKPIEKWLKYRIKDKISLTADDLNHLKNMIISIKNTISIMSEIEILGEEYLNI